jgi:two-component system response regulator RegA
MTSVLVIDDDITFCEVLSAALTARGFEVRIAAGSSEAMSVAQDFEPEWIVLDLKIGHASGLSLIPKLLALDPFTRIVVLTGYASIATAIEAIKLGAVHYLAKPAETQQIIAAFEKLDGDPFLPIDAAAQSVAEVEADHIRRALGRNQGNISATARELKMHRRTLQRKIDKMPQNI